MEHIHEKLDIKPITRERLKNIKLDGLKGLLKTGDVVKMIMTYTSGRTEKKRYVFVSETDMPKYEKMFGFETWDKNKKYSKDGFFVRQDLRYKYLAVSNFDENLVYVEITTKREVVQIKRMSNPQPLDERYFYKVNSIIFDELDAFDIIVFEKK